jgi:hypothetical protein
LLAPPAEDVLPPVALEPATLELPPAPDELPPLGSPGLGAGVVEPQLTVPRPSAAAQDKSGNAPRQAREGRVRVPIVRMDSYWPRHLRLVDK